MSIDDGGLAIDQGEDVAFWTNGDARTAAYASIHEDARVLSLGAVRKKWASIFDGARLRLRASVRAPVAEHEESKDASRNQPSEKSLHVLSQPQCHESQAHNHRDVDHGQNGECVTEWAMNHMPKMKQFLCMTEKEDSFGQGSLLFH